VHWPVSGVWFLSGLSAAYFFLCLSSLVCSAACIFDRILSLSIFNLRANTPDLDGFFAAPPPILPRPNTTVPNTLLNFFSRFPGLIGV